MYREINKQDIRRDYKESGSLEEVAKKYDLSILEITIIVGGNYGELRKRLSN